MNFFELNFYKNVVIYLLYKLFNMFSVKIFLTYFQIQNGHLDNSKQPQPHQTGQVRHRCDVRPGHAVCQGTA